MRVCCICGKRPAGIQALCDGCIKRRKASDRACRDLVDRQSRAEQGGIFAALAKPLRPGPVRMSVEEYNRSRSEQALLPFAEWLEQQARAEKEGEQDRRIDPAPPASFGARRLFVQRGRLFVQRGYQAPRSRKGVVSGNAFQNRGQPQNGGHGLAGIAAPSGRWKTRTIRIGD